MWGAITFHWLWTRTSFWGTGSRLTAATSAAGALIGIGATVLNGARVGEEAIVGAGSVVTPGAVIPPRTLALGTPAKPVRDLTERDFAMIKRTRGNYNKLMQVYNKTISPQERDQIHRISILRIVHCTLADSADLKEIC